jgi:uncharacterized protein YegJ (DUF2314 family)
MIGRASLALRLAALALLAAPASLAAQPQTAAGTEDKLVSVSERDPDMNAAIAEARRTLPEFLAVVAKPPPGVRDISFKYPLEGWEHIWVTNVQHRGDKLTGQLDNEPVAEGYRLGQQVEVPLSQVSDWSYRGADGVMRGHRTTRVILGKLPADEAAQIRAWMGWDE